MTDKKNHSDKENKEQFKPDESLNEIWEISSAAEPQVSLSEDEIEDALNRVRMETGAFDSSRREFFPRKFWVASRYLVAAVALIVLTFYFIFIPKTISVPYGERAVIELPDGSAAALNSGTTLSYYRFFLLSGRDIRLNGEAFFTVEQADTPFTVEANGSVTEVTGTSFNIRSWYNDPHSETTLTVTEGSVDFYPAQHSTDRVRVTGGQISRWNPRMEIPAEPDSVYTADFTGWMDNRLIFRDQPLIVIIQELERRFDIRIDLDVPGAGSETLTAFYNDPASASAILDDISMVKGLKYTQTANGFRVFK